MAGRGGTQPHNRMVENERSSEQRSEGEGLFSLEKRGRG